MYKSVHEIISKIQENYKDVTRLSRRQSDNMCMYGHSYNGVGCFIGTLLSKEDAEKLDEFAIAKGDGAILYMSLFHPQINSILSKYFDFNCNYIKIDTLHEIQRAHDNAGSVEMALQNLNDVVQSCKNLGIYE